MAVNFVIVLIVGVAIVAIAALVLDQVSTWVYAAFGAVARWFRSRASS